MNNHETIRRNTTRGGWAVLHHYSRTTGYDIQFATWVIGPAKTRPQAILLLKAWIRSGRKFPRLSEKENE